MPRERQWNTTSHMLLKSIVAILMSFGTYDKAMATKPDVNYVPFTIASKSRYSHPSHPSSKYAAMHDFTASELARVDVALAQLGKHSEVTDVNSLAHYILGAMSKQAKAWLAFRAGFSFHGIPPSTKIDAFRFSKFLYTRLNQQAGDKQLANSLRCMSFGTGDLMTLVSLISLREVQNDDGYLVRSDVPTTIDLIGNLSLAEKVTSLCASAGQKK